MNALDNMASSNPDSKSQLLRLHSPDLVSLGLAYEYKELPEAETQRVPAPILSRAARSLEI